MKIKRKKNKVEKKKIRPYSMQKIQLTLSSISASQEAFTPQQIVASNTFPHFHWTRSNCLLQRASLLRTPTTVSHNRRPNCCRWHSGKDISSTKRRQIFLLTLHNFALISTVRCKGLWLSAEWCIRTTHYWLTLIINDIRHLRYSLLLTSLSQSTPELCVGRSGNCASVASWQRQHRSVRTECKKWSQWLKLSHPKRSQKLNKTSNQIFLGDVYHWFFW